MLIAHEAFEIWTTDAPSNERKHPDPRTIGRQITEMTTETPLLSSSRFLILMGHKWSEKSQGSSCNN
jgi:hypothetical protein